MSNGIIYIKSTNIDKIIKKLDAVGKGYDAFDDPIGEDWINGSQVLSPTW